MMVLAELPSHVDLAWADAELEQAARALVGGDVGPALDLLKVTREQADRRELCVEVLGAAGSVVLPAMREAAAGRRGDGDVLLLWGSALNAAAWEARGAADSRHTTAAQLGQQADLTRRARATLVEAAKLAPEDVGPWSVLMWCALGDPAHERDGDEVFAEVQKRAPELFGANAARLQMLAAKWYGSNDAVLEFARAGRRDLPAGHPLLALVPSAYIEIHIEQMSSGNVFKRMAKSSYLSKKPVRAEVDAASDWLHTGADIYRTHPRWYRAQQIFACYYQQASEWVPEDRARIAGHIAQSGDRPTLWPWGYFGDHEEQFAKARKVAARVT
jgi:hypothetical protein